MIGKLKNLNGAKLIAFCAAVLCVLWLGKNAVAFGAETAARAGGKMETVTLSADDFELIGIVKGRSGIFCNKTLLVLSRQHNSQQLHSSDADEKLQVHPH